MWKDPKFLADYSKVIKTEPILVSGSDGQEILSGVAKVRPEVTDIPGEIRREPDPSMSAAGRAG